MSIWSLYLVIGPRLNGSCSAKKCRLFSSPICSGGGYWRASQLVAYQAASSTVRLNLYDHEPNLLVRAADIDAAVDLEDSLGGPSVFFVNAGIPVSLVLISSHLLTRSWRRTSK